MFCIKFVPSNFFILPFSSCLVSCSHAMVYFLLPNKRRETYHNAFVLLKEVSQNYGFTFMPSYVKADYELALVQSLQICKGCYYHFSQAIW